jgi:hypothetical protein
LGFPTGWSFTSSTTHQQVLWHYSSLCHQQVLWHHCRGLKKKIEEEEAPTSNTHSPVNLAPSNAINLSGTVAGEEKEDFCNGSFAHTSFTLF